MQSIQSPGLDQIFNIPKERSNIGPVSLQLWIFPPFQIQPKCAQVFDTTLCSLGKWARDE